jgi:hypothetical protein
MGVKATFDDVDARPGVIQANAYRYMFDRIPGSPEIDINAVSLDCLASTWPGRSVGKIDLNFAGGHTISYPGDQAFTRTAAARFIERSGFETFTWLHKWHEQIKGTKSGNAATYRKLGLVAVSQLEMYDETGAVANSCRLINTWPSELSEISPDSDTRDSAVIWQVTFSFDIVEYDKSPAR